MIVFKYPRLLMTPLEVKEKLVENLRGCTYNITHMSAGTILNYENRYQMKVETEYFTNKTNTQ